MCCYSTDSGINKVLRNNIGKCTITAYKVLRKVGKKLVSPYQTSKSWDVGVSISNATDTSLRIGYAGISKGIHVYLTENSALNERYSHRDSHVVKLKCSMKDLMASDGDHSVFAKATLTQDEYDRVMGKRKAKPKTTSRKR